MAYFAEGRGEGLAGPVSGSVWVGGLGWDPVLLDPVEGGVHQAPVAPLVPVLGTVHQGLFGELLQGPGLDGVDALNGPDGGEGPA